MVEEEGGVAVAAVAALPEPFRFRRLELSLALITFSVTAAGAVLRLFAATFFSATTSVSLFCEKGPSLGDAEAGEKGWKVGRGVYSASSSASWTPAPASSMASGLNQLLGWKLTSGGGEVGCVLLPDPESSPERKKKCLKIFFRFHVWSGEINLRLTETLSTDKQSLIYILSPGEKEFGIRNFYQN